jgi:hypothetical protein
MNNQQMNIQEVYFVKNEWMDGWEMRIFGLDVRRTKTPF